MEPFGNDRAGLYRPRALRRIPRCIPDELFNRLLQQFSYPELVELAATIAFENYRARFNRVFDIGSGGFSHGAVCALPVHRNS